MASPQVEKGFIRIANELWNEILRRNFSKRQLNLILFLWRLSYGTGQKDCKIEKFNQLELAGMYKQDVKKELEHLRECAVLNWDEKTMVFSINKNYKMWQITPNKNWDSEKFDSLIHLNLSRKKVSETPTGRKQEVSKTLTYKSGRVSKLLTMRLVKYLPAPNGKSIVPRSSSSLKTVLKTLKIKDIKREEEDTHAHKENPFVIYEQNFGILKPILRDSLIAWCEDLGDDIVIAGMKLAAQKGGYSFSYMEAIWKEWANQKLETLDQVRAYELEKRNRKNNKVTPINQRIKPKKESSYLLDKYREV
ncbi:replication protein [Oceanobacillus alkalisoli]|uniref:replication protein n=1 Tax=Oceanobacillus alkalisoli TaxID=2925113 RepID=UPI001EE44AD2|nr:replication protein [Oceanobacillus alkalisoli]MCG5104410.1 replication protein [Oceanobacillus alkalisoli]